MRIPTLKEIFLREVEDVEAYDQWQRPDDSALELEYKVEYQNHFKYDVGDLFPSVEDWKEAINNGKVVSVDESMDRKIANRSRTSSYEDLLSLIKGYRSYPEFRNEKTIQNLYNRIKNNKPLDMPLVFKDENGRLRVVSGNTRMDVAFQLGVNPEVVVFEAPEE